MQIHDLSFSGLPKFINLENEFWTFCREVQSIPTALYFFLQYALSFIAHIPLITLKSPIIWDYSSPYIKPLTFFYFFTTLGGHFESDIAFIVISCIVTVIHLICVVTLMIYQRMFLVHYTLSPISCKFAIFINDFLKPLFLLYFPYYIGRYIYYIRKGQYVILFFILLIYTLYFVIEELFNLVFFDIFTIDYVKGRSSSWNGIHYIEYLILTVFTLFFVRLFENNFSRTSNSIFLMIVFILSILQTVLIDITMPFINQTVLILNITLSKTILVVLIINFARLFGVNVNPLLYIVFIAILFLAVYIFVTLFERRKQMKALHALDQLDDGTLLPKDYVDQVSLYTLIHTQRFALLVGHPYLANFELFRAALQKYPTKFVLWFDFLRRLAIFPQLNSLLKENYKVFKSCVSFSFFLISFRFSIKKLFISRSNHSTPDLKSNFNAIHRAAKSMKQLLILYWKAVEEHDIDGSYDYIIQLYEAFTHVQNHFLHLAIVYQNNPTVCVKYAHLLDKIMRNPYEAKLWVHRASLLQDLTVPLFDDPQAHAYETFPLFKSHQTKINQNIHHNDVNSSNENSLSSQQASIVSINPQSFSNFLSKDNITSIETDPFSSISRDQSHLYSAFWLTGNPNAIKSEEGLPSKLLYYGLEKKIRSAGYIKFIVLFVLLFGFCLQAVLCFLLLFTFSSKMNKYFFKMVKSTELSQIIEVSSSFILLKLFSEEGLISNELSTQNNYIITLDQILKSNAIYLNANSTSNYSFNDLINVSLYRFYSRYSEYETYIADLLESSTPSAQSFRNRKISIVQASSQLSNSETSIFSTLTHFDSSLKHSLSFFSENLFHYTSARYDTVTSYFTHSWLVNSVVNAHNLSLAIMDLSYYFIDDLKDNISSSFLLIYSLYFGLNIIIVLSFPLLYWYIRKFRDSFIHVINIFSSLPHSTFLKITYDWIDDDVDINIQSNHDFDELLFAKNIRKGFPFIQMSVYYCLLILLFIILSTTVITLAETNITSFNNIVQYAYHSGRTCQYLFYGYQLILRKLINYQQEYENVPLSSRYLKDNSVDLGKELITTSNLLSDSLSNMINSSLAVSPALNASIRVTLNNQKKYTWFNSLSFFATMDELIEIFNSFVNTAQNTEPMDFTQNNPNEYSDIVLFVKLSSRILYADMILINNDYIEARFSSTSSRVFIIIAVFSLFSFFVILFTNILYFSYIDLVERYIKTTIATISMIPVKELDEHPILYDLFSFDDLNLSLDNDVLRTYLPHLSNPLVQQKLKLGNIILNKSLKLEFIDDLTCGFFNLNPNIIWKDYLIQSVVNFTNPSILEFLFEVSKFRGSHQIKNQPINEQELKFREANESMCNENATVYSSDKNDKCKYFITEVVGDKTHQKFQIKILTSSDKIILIITKSKHEESDDITKLTEHMNRLLHSVIPPRLREKTSPSFTFYNALFIAFQLDLQNSQLYNTTNIPAILNNSKNTSIPNTINSIPNTINSIPNTINNIPNTNNNISNTNNNIPNATIINPNPSLSNTNNSNNTNLNNVNTNTVTPSNGNTNNISPSKSNTNNINPSNSNTNNLNPSKSNTNNVTPSNSKTNNNAPNKNNAKPTNSNIKNSNPTSPKIKNNNANNNRTNNNNANNNRTNNNNANNNRTNNTTNNKGNINQTNTNKNANNNANNSANNSVNNSVNNRVNNSINNSVDNSVNNSVNNSINNSLANTPNSSLNNFNNNIASNPSLSSINNNNVSNLNPTKNNTINNNTPNNISNNTNAYNITIHDNYLNDVNNVELQKLYKDIETFKKIIMEEAKKNETAVTFQQVNTTIYVGLNVIKATQTLHEIGTNLITLFNNVTNATSNRFKFRAGASFAKSGSIGFYKEGLLRYEVFSKAIHTSYTLAQVSDENSLVIESNVHDILSRKDSQFFSKASVVIPGIGCENVYVLNQS